jgi:putative transcription factor
MFCEICGNLIRGKPSRSKIDGVDLLLCYQCAQLSPSQRSYKINKQPTKEVTTSRVLIRKHKTRPLFYEDKELVENYDQIIRKAREGMGLSHKDLGKKISERASVIQKLEVKKIVPNQTLVKKLEHTLKIQLTQPYESITTGKDISTIKFSETTLGDLISRQKKTRLEDKETRKR